MRRPCVCACAASEGVGYYCVATTTYGSTASGVAVIRVSPAITTQPLSTSKGAGQVATFSVVATGPSLTYNWQRNGVSAGAASAASYSYTPTVSEIGTTIAVTCVVSGVYGPSRWCLYACVPSADCKAHGSWSSSASPLNPLVCVRLFGAGDQRQRCGHLRGCDADRHASPRDHPAADRRDGECGWLGGVHCGGHWERRPVVQVVQDDGDHDRPVVHCVVHFHGGAG